jgi:hypothetical protein
MGETTQERVDRMAAAGEWPEPALLQAIADRGEEAVGPLLGVVRRDAHGWPEEAPQYHALGLLTHLPRSAEALAAATDLFRRYGSEMVESAAEVVTPYGMQAFEPMVELFRDRTIRWYSRGTAGEIATRVSRDHPEQRARIMALLREELAYLVGKANDVSDDEVSMASSLVVDLAHAADPQDRPLLQAALDAGLSEMMGEEDVEVCYRRGPLVQAARPRDWLWEYKKSYDNHQAYLRRRAEPPPPPRRGAPSRQAPPSTKAPAFRPAPLTFSSPERKVGRNDPCWCGSGKKYKNCHLNQDRS